MSGGWLGARAALVAVGVVVAMVFGVSGASAATLTVCESGPPTCGFTEIQSAVNAASTGDTIEIAAGHYNVDRLAVPGGGTATSLTLRGEKGRAGETTIDGGRHGMAVTISPGESVAITGVTITNGSGFGIGQIAGGIDNEGTLALNSSSVFHNEVSFAGGGITNSGTLTLHKSTVNENKAGHNGGGIWNNGGTVTLQRSTVSGNEARGVHGGEAEGGGIANGGGTVTLHDSIVSGNIASREGGGISNRGTLAMNRSSTLTGNSANTVGGGIFNTGTAVLSYDTISNNSAGGEGGGISTESGGMTITNSALTGNHAAHGGGINETTGSLTLHHSTVSGNEAVKEGGGLDGYTMELINTKIIENAAEEGGGIYNHELVKGSYDTITGNTALIEPGIFSVPGAMVTLTHSSVQP